MAAGLRLRKRRVAAKFPDPGQTTPGGDWGFGLAIIIVAIGGNDTISPPPVRRFGHYPALDGLRGVSILAVLLFHGLIIGGGASFIAVNTFFVLSGFLITSILLEEWDHRHDLSLRKFYMRRALRLLPALIAMLVVFCIVGFAADPLKRALREFYEALRALFYCTNWAIIYHIRPLALNHTWSLSVEEQFYLVWPLLLLLLLRKNSPSSLACWVALGVCLAVLDRICCAVLGSENLSGNILPVNPLRLEYGSDTRADSLLVGCLAAVLLFFGMLPGTPRFKGALRWGALASIAGLIGFDFAPPQARWMVFIGWLAISLLAAIIILQIVHAPGGPLQWILASPPLVFLGKISYGLYVWHFPIRQAMIYHAWRYNKLTYLVVSFAAALLSYYLLERPALRLKTRFAG